MEDEAKCKSLCILKFDCGNSRALVYRPAAVAAPVAAYFKRRDYSRRFVIKKGFKRKAVSVWSDHTGVLILSHCGKE